MVDRTKVPKAVALAGSAILVIVWGIFSLASFITSLLGLPSSLGLQQAPRMFGGGALFVAGLGLVLWLLRYRSPATMIVSTYYTFVKMVTRAPVSQIRGRTEPLVVSGPQKYVRHPLYLGALGAFLGWAIFNDSVSGLVGVAFIFLWFRSVQIPYEERELRAIFGDQYVRYSEEVPMLFPYRGRKSR